MVAAGPMHPTAERPCPNVLLIHRPGEAEAPATLSRPPLAVRKRVLAVDDEHPVLKLQVRLLKKRRFA